MVNRLGERKKFRQKMTGSGVDGCLEVVLAGIALNKRR
jgi:hypothetical protein